MIVKYLDLMTFWSTDLQFLCSLTFIIIIIMRNSRGVSMMRTGLYRVWHMTRPSVNQSIRKSVHARVISDPRVHAQTFTLSVRVSSDPICSHRTDPQTRKNSSASDSEPRWRRESRVQLVLYPVRPTRLWNKVRSSRTARSLLQWGWSGGAGSGVCEWCLFTLRP